MKLEQRIKKLKPYYQNSDLTEANFPAPKTIRTKKNKTKKKVVKAWAVMKEKILVPRWWAYCAVFNSVVLILVVLLSWGC